MRLAVLLTRSDVLPLRLLQGFPKGEHFEVPRWPNVTVVNSLGDFEIAADRLAFVDGDCTFLPLLLHSAPR